MKFSSAVAALAASGASATSTGQDASPQLSRRDDTNGSYIPATAPVDNIFAGITPKEEEAIYSFLNREANHTVPGDLSFYNLMWLLPPNKTEATAYLNGDGPKPARYARTMASGDCYSREYMIGPLPVGNSTKVVPLDYANGGNATFPSSWCEGGDDEEGPPDGPPGSPEDAPSRDDEPRSRRARRDLERRSPHNPYEEEMTWNKRKMAHDEKAPPVAILPDGARHEFDPEQNYVSWMDYTFFVSHGPGGISLHDVRFKGERIIYELAMQEALAHYAGPDQDQTYASYLDVNIGFTQFNLIPGYDCPAYATYTDAFCLFEYPKDYPMSRHYNYDYYHATKNIAFMVRSISTVGNYDYQTTYEFHYDGSIQVLVRASGYIQGSDFVEGEDPWEYGFRIRNELSGSMHDHVLNFKLDLDINGTQNSLLKTEFVPHAQVYEWSGGEVQNTMKVERSYITNEDQGKINWAPNAAAAYSVVNKDQENEFGEHPGFRIYPSTGSSIHVTVENSTVFGNNINWATHQLYALRRKDSEPVAAHPSADLYSDDVQLDFNDFFDGESLEQEDIVLYFNLGMHHMPDTYDLPVTVFQGAQSGITIRPQNYFRSDSSVATRQQVHITNENDEAKAEYYGADQLEGSYDLSSARPSWYPVPDAPWDSEESSEE